MCEGCLRITGVDTFMCVCECDNERFPLRVLAAKVGKKLSGGEGRFFELKVFSYQPRSHTSVDHEFSGAHRIAHDTKLSLKVAEALDKEFRRADSNDAIAALLAEPEVS